jgi:hypothetical protein
LVNPKASTFLAILEIFCSGVRVRELLASQPVDGPARRLATT